MKNIQKFSFALVGTLALLVVVFISSVYLDQQMIPTSMINATLASTPTYNNLPTQSLQGEEKVRITFAHLSGSASQYESLIGKFETEHPEIDVQLLSLGDDSTNLEGLVAQADTILLNNAIPTSSSALLLDLEPLIASKGLQEDNFWPNSLQGCRAGDEQKGLPIYLGPRLVLYNKDLFDQAGVAYPQPGWTWNEFRTAVQVLSAPGGGQTRYGFLAFSPISILSPMIDARLEAGKDAAGLASEMQWYVELSKAGAITTQQDGSELIRQGRAAMWLGTLSSMTLDYQGLGFEVGAAPFPAEAQNQASTTMQVSCAVITAGTRNPTASYSWLTFLSNNPPRDYQYFAPAHIVATETSGYWGSINPETAITVRYALEHGWYRWVQQDFSPLGEALNNAITSELSLESLLAEAISTVLVQAEAPAIESTPVAVVPPTPTEEPGGIPEDALSAVYYADQGYHTSQKDLIALAEEFNRTHPGMHIEIATKRIGFENVKSSIYDVENYDCFVAPGGVIDDSDFAGKVYFLNPLLETESGQFLGDLNPNILDASYRNGSLYGLPVAIQPYVVFYNAALLQDLGLKPPSINWTVDDFWSLASEAAARRNNIYGYVPHGTQPFDFLSDFSYLERTGNWPEANFDSPELIELLNQLALLVENRTMFLYESGGTRSAMGNYMERDEIMQFNEGLLWIDTPGMPIVTHVPDEVGIATLPIPQSLDLSNTSFIYISRHAQNPQVCWQWIKYLEEQPVNVFQGIPLRQSILESDTWEASVGEQQAVVYRATMANLEFTIGNDSWPPMPLNQWWNDALVAVLKDGQDPYVILRAVQYKTQATLDCMKAAGIPQSLPYEQSYEIAVSCAHEVDPTYVSPSELWRKQSTP